MRNNVWEIGHERKRSFYGMIASGATQAIDRFGQFQQLRSSEYLNLLGARTLEGNAKLVDQQIQISRKEKELTKTQVKKISKKVQQKQLRRFGKANVSGASVEKAQDDLNRQLALEALAIDYQGTKEETRLVGLRGQFRGAAAEKRLTAASQRKAAFFADPSTSLISTF
jgi:hypothetical protein